MFVLLTILKCHRMEWNLTQVGEAAASSSSAKDAARPRECDEV